MRRLVFFPFPKRLAKLLPTLTSTTTLSGESLQYCRGFLIHCLQTFQIFSRPNTWLFIIPKPLNAILAYYQSLFQPLIDVTATSIRVVTGIPLWHHAKQNNQEDGTNPKACVPTQLTRHRSSWRYGTDPRYQSVKQPAYPTRQAYHPNPAQAIPYPSTSHAIHKPHSLQ